MDSHRLTQVLHRLRLAGTRRPFRGSTIQQIDGSNHCAVAAVSQSSDHQSHRVAQVLIAIQTPRIHDPRDHGLVPLLARLAVLPGILPIVPQLRHPLEVCDVMSTQVNHLRHHITIVDIDGGQRAQRLPLQLAQLPSHEHHDVPQLHVQLVVTLYQGHPSALPQSVGHLGGPVHARPSEDHLSRPVEDPLLPVDLHILL